MKKLLSILTLVTLVVTLFSGSVFAAEINVLDGVSTINPSERISLDGTSKPTEVKDLNKEISYHFHGTTYKETTTLYTEYLFTGKGVYAIGTTNNGKKALTVSLMKGYSTLGKITIKPGEKKFLTVTDVGKSSKVYVKFSSSTVLDFTGNIY